MRLSSLLALSTMGAGYLTLMACDSGEKPAETDTDTDADADADSDADTDTDTAPTGFVPTGPLVWIGYAGGGIWDGATYAGSETLGVFEFTNGPPASDADFVAATNTPLCAFQWPVTAPGPYAGTSCPSCTFDMDVTFGDETTATETGPAGGCAAFGIDATSLAGGNFGYGYDPAYDYMGYTYSALYFTSDGTWGAASITGVSYDDTSGQFDYLWPTDAGYLQ